MGDTDSTVKGTHGARDNETTGRSKRWDEGDTAGDQESERLAQRALLVPQSRHGTQSDDRPFYAYHKREPHSQ